MLDFAVRRGLEHVGGVHALKRSLTRDGKQEVDFPVWGMVLVGFTVVLFMVFATVVDYTLQNLITTLAMTETPGTSITITTPQEPATGEEKAGLLETGPETTLVRQKPITASIRATLQHLRSEHGRWAYLKGFGYHWLYAVAVSWITNLFLVVLPKNFFTYMIAAALGGAICAPLHAAWTNKVISKDSNMTFWQRVARRSAWKVLAVPAALYAILPYLMFIIFTGLGFAVRGCKNPAWGSFVQLVGGIVTVFMVTIFLYIPIMTVLIRTEASLLSEDQDTIVPFDRTFAGKLVPASLGGSGVLSFKDALTSVDREGRWRIFKHLLKSLFTEFFMFVMLFHVVVFELFVIFGSSFGEALHLVR